MAISTISSDGQATRSPTAGATSHHALCLTFARCGPITALRLRHHAHLVLREHQHERACFSLAIVGEFTERFQRQTLVSNRHAVLFRPAGAPHSDHYGSEDADDVLLEISNSWMQRLCQTDRLTFGVPAIRNAMENAQIVRRLVFEMELSDGASPIAIEGLALQVASQFLRRTIDEHSEKPPRWLRQARDMIDASYTHAMTLELISESVGVHPVHLSKEFPRYFGHSVTDFIRLRRVEYAQRELRASNVPIGQVALQAGFADQSHFNKTFKRMTGLTPSTYRKKTR